MAELRRYYEEQEKSPAFKIFHDSSRVLQQIILLRHGEPDLKKEGWRNRREALSFMRAYDSVGVKRIVRKPFALRTGTVRRVFHSSMQRARHTAEQLFSEYQLEESASFREFERKPIVFFNVPMPTSFWVGSSRFFWLMGFNSHGIESVGDARRRTRINAYFMSEISKKEKTVVLVAHGLHNRELARYLKRMGWEMVYNSGDEYLSFKILAKPGI
ncbi:MAG: histidine phosphatase family protein [Cytophagales bacterium]|nr:histidine phosphatase family protein [Cytophagales bacterium]